MQDVKPSRQGRHGEHWEGVGDEAGRDGHGETAGNGQSCLLSSEGERCGAEVVGGNEQQGAGGIVRWWQGRSDSDVGCGLSRRKQ